MKHVLDRPDRSALTRQHDLQIGRADRIDQGSMCPETH